MADLKDLKEVVKFIVEAAEAGVVRNIPEVAEAIQALFPAMDGIKNIDLDSLSSADYDEVVEYGKNEFDIPNDEVESIIEDVLDGVSSIGKAVKKIAALKKKE